jgi:hypothetical protein
MEDAAREHLQVRRGEDHHRCEGAAGHGVGIERVGNGQVAIRTALATTFCVRRLERKTDDGASQRSAEDCLR